MPVIINASPSNGLVQTADGSGIVKVQSNGVTTNALAWCNFNGTLSGPITPRANYNVSSITKNSTADYTLNFTSALSDANYAIAGTARRVSGQSFTVVTQSESTAQTTSAVRILVVSHLSVTSSLLDSDYVYVSVFGN